MAHYLIFLLMCVTANVYADTLRDPTTPAMAWMPASTAEQALNLNPELQSVILGTQQQAAIINGKLVPLGQQYEQYKLVKLSENSAILRAADGSQQVLKMRFPIEKTPANNNKLLNKTIVKNK